MVLIFRKVYADVVTADGTVAVVYLGWARVLGVWSGRCGVEIYRPDGTRAIRHGAGPAPVPADVRAEDVPLRVVLADGVAEMTVETVHGPWAPVCPEPSIAWRVLAARTRAVLRLPGETLEGTGYVDWVELTRGPRGSGLRTLQWGRVHEPDRTTVVESLDFADGRAWRLSRTWPGTDGFGAFEVGDDGRGAATADGRPIRLEPTRLLHADAAFDPERIPSWLDRQASRLLAGPTAEKRWLGRAGEGGAVWERVRFGRS